MTKTTWAITNETENTTTEFTLYHFGKEPRFPAWYFEKGYVYKVEMVWSFKLIRTFNTFLKCLTHSYIVK